MSGGVRWSLSGTLRARTLPESGMTGADDAAVAWRAHPVRFRPVGTERKEGAMFSVVWGVFATALGWTVASDFRGAAHRFHALSHAVVPFGGARATYLGVGFFRLAAGVFALAGPVVLVSGLVEVWHGGVGPDGPLPIPVWFVVAEAIVVGAVLWRTWRCSGVLRREWDAGHGPRRAAVAGVTAAAAAFVVMSGLGQGTWMTACWSVGGLCGLVLLLGEPTDRP
ncbi:hypothetical protein AB0D99_11790 [Streptomyces sp. NPDC047971]|uniref:hypothetical protein n=1 Tax=Streptomyces sp. NPDC047971 TaxID=3154499 RepID=UPI0033E76D27